MALRTPGNTLLPSTIYYQDFIKDTDEQPEEEVYRVRPEVS